MDKHNNNVGITFLSILVVFIVLLSSCTTSRPDSDEYDDIFHSFGFHIEDLLGVWHSVGVVLVDGNFQNLEKDLDIMVDIQRDNTVLITTNTATGTHEFLGRWTLSEDLYVWDNGYSPIILLNQGDTNYELYATQINHRTSLQMAWNSHQSDKLKILLLMRVKMDARYPE